MAEPDAAADIDGAMSSPARQAFADRLVEDGEAFVELGLGDGQWRRNAPDARRAPVAADVHAEAQIGPAPVMRAPRFHRFVKQTAAVRITTFQSVSVDVCICAFKLEIELQF